jgi:hypothetical protein
LHQTSTLGWISKGRTFNRENKTSKLQLNFFLSLEEHIQSYKGNWSHQRHQDFFNEVQRTYLLSGTCLTDPHVLINIVHSMTTTPKPMDASCSPWHIRPAALESDRLKKNKMKHEKHEGWRTYL